ncbi:type II toxin-antitoxin system PemK/MazF family toxin [Thiomicrospira sp. R3]|uniref:type II toxin-antitoxin system PemK/MazF family toxin n=1 Tax=Thiomicrospira sp. R3 TaxID=3035472 RepID=UPI00259B35D4|nr:type II toxin-antitoxin system PemK/MazF family toxin [Thiomicrospira sp. R3]WFE68666.1 type II toxin-antitoxin system PemK/MazF family toxin [Thiomicrospira sp. R3]
MVSRGDVYWVELDPTVGSEIRKTRPCLIIAPNDMNSVLPRVIIAPITSKGQALGCRPEVVFNGKQARILLDQVRTVDKKRLKNQMGSIPLEIWHDTLIQMLS